MNKVKKLSAFSLVELSIVILIISILITGTLTVSRSAINNARIKETKDKLQEINKAIAIYLNRQKRIPCPASLILVKTDTSYGQEAGTAGNCLDGSGVYSSSDTNAEGLVYGAVPTATLSLDREMAEDGFGSKFSYIVPVKLTESYIEGSVDGYEGTLRNQMDLITVNELSETGSSINDEIILVVMSHGADKYGAFSATSASQNSYTDATDDEIANLYKSDFDQIFVTNSDEENFDDILIYKTRPQLNKDAELEYTLCLSQDASNDYNPCSGGNFTWSSNVFYGESSDSDNNCNQNSCSSGTQIPSRICGKYGEWSSVNNGC